jgi:hypothetical protein
VRHRVGRRSHYQVKTDLPLRHAIESHHTVAELVELLSVVDAAARTSQPRTKAQQEP